MFSAEDLAQMSPEEKQELEAEARKQEDTITKTVTVKSKPKRKFSVTRVWSHLDSGTEIKSREYQTFNPGVETGRSRLLLL